MNNRKQEMKVRMGLTLTNWNIPSRTPANRQWHTLAAAGGFVEEKGGFYLRFKDQPTTIVSPPSHPNARKGGDLGSHTSWVVLFQR